MHFVREEIAEQLSPLKKYFITLSAIMHLHIPGSGLILVYSSYQYLNKKLNMICIKFHQKNKTLKTYIVDFFVFGYFLKTFKKRTLVCA